MVINETAAAFGLFQIAYAYLVDLLATAVSMLEQTATGPSTPRKKSPQFGETLRKLKKHLRRFKGRPDVAVSVTALRCACIEMKRLADWRNERSHARVRLTDQGFVLFDWKTRQPLSISYAETEEKVGKVIAAAVALQTHVPVLVGNPRLNALLEEILSPVPGLETQDE